jgi:hypothetical protein
MFTIERGCTRHDWSGTTGEEEEESGSDGGWPFLKGRGGAGAGGGGEKRHAAGEVGGGVRSVTKSRLRWARALRGGACRE